MLRTSMQILSIVALLASPVAMADDLTKMIQKDLIVLGYDPGNIQGELSTATVVAISKFQAENNLEVTGDPTPQLAGIIKAKIDAGNNAAGSTAQIPVSTESPQPDAAALQAAQQQCLQEKIEAKQKAEKKKKGFNSLLRAVVNTSTRFGDSGEIARQVNETSRDVYDVNATAKDWEQAAEDLGLTQDELEECKNPQ
ncbi:MAG: peptidoglycan-binding domain-containing protein [Pseudomonadota bacterium]